MNTLGGAMLELLSGYILAAERDPDVRVIILTGNGRAFCAGLDLASAAEDPELPGPLTPHARRRPGYARDSALT
jgi:enoyl-CoA hydratase/carnithine racemase